MKRFSMWWLFLVLFGLTIGGIQSLGWWTKSNAAEPAAVSASGPAATAATRRHVACQPKHWRAAFMHQ